MSVQALHARLSAYVIDSDQYEESVKGSRRAYIDSLCTSVRILRGEVDGSYVFIEHSRSPRIRESTFPGNR